MSGVLQGSILGPTLFNILASGVYSGVERTLSKFMGDTELSSAVDSLREGTPPHPEGPSVRPCEHHEVQ